MFFASNSPSSLWWLVMILANASGMKLEIKESHGTSSFVQIENENNATDISSSPDLSEDFGRPSQVANHTTTCDLGLVIGSLRNLWETFRSQRVERRDELATQEAPRQEEKNTTFWKTNGQWRLWGQKVTRDEQGNILFRILPNPEHPLGRVFAEKYPKSWFTLVRQAMSDDLEKGVKPIDREKWQRQFMWPYFDPKGQFRDFCLNRLADDTWDENGNRAFLFEATTDRLRHYCRPGSIPLDDKLYFMQKIAEIIEALHQDKLLHRDITADHFYFTPGPEPNSLSHVKIFNFYQATLLSKAHGDGSWEGLLVSPPLPQPLPDSFRFYGAPEVLSSGGERYTSKSEIYAVGVLYYEFLTGKIPVFQGTVQDGKYKQISQGLKEAGVNNDASPKGALKNVAKLLDRMMSNSEGDTKKCGVIPWSAGRPTITNVKRMLQAIRGGISPDLIPTQEQQEQAKLHAEIRTALARR